MTEPTHHSEEISVAELAAKVKEYLLFLIKKWWLLLILIGGAAIGGYLYGAAKDRLFVSTAAFSLTAPGSSTGSTSSSIASLAKSVGFSTGSTGTYTNELLIGTILSRKII